LIFYALEDRSPWFILAFAFSCLTASAYGFLQGAWPFGLVEAIWALVAARRWWQLMRPTPTASMCQAGIAAKPGRLGEDEETARLVSTILQPIVLARAVTLGR
ncbi:MAG: hypothetical protein ACP5RC_08475, partial [Halothiobacillaceae bacterium]